MQNFPHIFAFKFAFIFSKTLQILLFLLDNIISCLTRKEFFMSTHLSLTDRTVIERLIAMHYSFSYIARELRRSPSTIAREVLKRRTFTSHFRAGSNDCIEYFNCLHKHLCPTETKYTCFQNCKFCTEYNCTTICEFYISEHCPKIGRASCRERV